MKNRGKVAVLALLMLMTLSGCFMRSVDEMYAIPQPPEEFQNLDAKIQEIKTALNAEYATPLSGRDAQNIQLQDLDGDGEQESAICFLRVTNAEKPLRIYVFTRQPDDSYETSCIIEGEGSAIYSVSYEDLGGDPAKELVVSWQISPSVHTLAAYSLVSSEALELMRTSYTKFCIMDLDMDNQKEIVAFKLDPAPEGKNCAELYDYDGTVMALSASAPLSAGVTELKSVVTGRLRDSVPALFATSLYGDDKQQVVDVFALGDQGFVNVLMDPGTGMSTETMRYYVMGGRDIDGDSVLELPQGEALPEFNSTTTAPNYWTLHWRQFDVDGNVYPVCTTYHNASDGWYMILPDWWQGKITASRRDLSSTGERRLVFSLWEGTDKEPIDFLTIYTLTGANRAGRAEVGNREPLLEEAGTIYACEFSDTSWDCGLDRDSLLERFSVLRNEWSSEF